MPRNPRRAMIVFLAPYALVICDLFFLFYFFLSFLHFWPTHKHARELASRATMITWELALNYLREKSRGSRRHAMLSPLWYKPYHAWTQNLERRIPGRYFFGYFGGWNVLGSRDLLTYHTLRHQPMCGWGKGKGKEESPAPPPLLHFWPGFGKGAN